MYQGKSFLHDFTTVNPGWLVTCHSHTPICSQFNQSFLEYYKIPHVSVPWGLQYDAATNWPTQGHNVMIWPGLGPATLGSKVHCHAMWPQCSTSIMFTMWKDYSTRNVSIYYTFHDTMLTVYGTIKDQVIVGLINFKGLTVNVFSKVFYV